MTTRIFAALLFSCLFPGVAPASADTDAMLEDQRTAFRAVRADVERGNWQPVLAHEKLLQDYVLWPDLRATYFRANLKSADRNEIEAFLDRFGVLKPARELRYQYVLHLASENRLAEFLTIYRQFYQGLGIANLDCLALQAEIHSGQTGRVTNRALELWKIGKSQADECDPVFETLRHQKLLGRSQYLERFDLAIEARNFSLARFLARSLDARYLEIAEEWLSAQNHPTTFVATFANYADTELSKRLFAYAVERIAYDDPLAAYKHWQALTAHFSFTSAQIDRNNRHIALWAARERLPEAEKMLTALSDDATDVEAGRWLVRTRLLRRNWQGVVDGVNALPDEERQKADWQYWKAAALQELGRPDEARALFSGLAPDRSYYGFLAADAIEADYTFSGIPVAMDEQLTAGIADLPELVRARELFMVGLEGRGRSEWDSAVRLMNSDQQMQAALLADSWGWHSRAIATVAIAGDFDDLRIRYPLPWRSEFGEHASTAGISDSWAYGIARSESLFMRDIRSSAGAIGVMQVMPATGRSAAREIRLPWSGQATLTDSSSNIRLGTYYLGQMYARFDDNRVLATAAYNAGPHRVQGWLPESGSLDARIWIENVPYNETRAYVRRVLTDDAIFHWRMTGQQRRISSELPLVVAAPGQIRASNTD